MALWRPKNQPGPKVVSSGSVRNKIVPPWRPKNQAAPKKVQGVNPPVEPEE